MGFGDFIRKAYPWLAAGASFGGPVGVMVAKTIGDHLGMDVQPDKIESTLAQAAFTDPETRQKLQAAEEEFQKDMAQMGFDHIEKLEEIAAADRASARAREIAVKDKLPAILAISVTVGFFGLLAVFAFRDIPSSSQTILNVLVGSLGTAWVGIINYYFGSSSGSAKKTELLSQSK